MELPICSPIQTNSRAADFSGNETWNDCFVQAVSLAGDFSAQQGMRNGMTVLFKPFFLLVILVLSRE